MGVKASQFPLQQNTAVQYSVSMVITSLLISHFWTFIFLLRPSKIISLGSKEIKPINLKGNQPWTLIRRTQCWNGSSNTLAAWCQQSAHWKSQEEEEEKGVTGDEMVGWHHGFNGHELEQTPGDGEGQESLEYCSLWGHKESNLTWRLNNSSKKIISNVIRVVTAPSP